MRMGTGADEDLAEYVSHQDFRAGMARAQWRVIVNPKLASGYVSRRLWLRPVVLAAIGMGLALALTGSPWPGAALVAAGIGVNRLVRWKAGAILLHLALHDPAVYQEATQNGMLEVRPA
jgi:hypothetical protein